MSWRQFGIGLLVAVSCTVGMSLPAAADTGFVGMRVQGITPMVARGLRLEPPRGVIVRDVALGGPAAAAGVEPGDILISLNDRSLRDFDHLLDLIGETRPRQKLALTVWRRGKEVSLAMTTGKWPGQWQVDEDAAMVVGKSGMTVASLTAERREEFAIRWGRTGLLVTEVDEASLSFRQGIRPGDVIETINQEPVWLPEHVSKKFLQARNRELPVVVFLIDQPSGKVMLPVSVEE